MLKWAYPPLIITLDVDVAETKVKQFWKELTCCLKWDQKLNFAFCDIQRVFTDRITYTYLNQFPYILTYLAIQCMISSITCASIWVRQTEGWYRTCSLHRVFCTARKFTIFTKAIATTSWNWFDNDWFDKARKNKLYVSKLPCAFDSAKVKLIFFCLLNFFFQLACQNIGEKTWQHNQTLWTTDFFNSVSCILFFQNSRSIFHTEQSCYRLKFETSAAKKKKKKKNMLKKTHLGQVFQSVTSFET